MIQNFTVAEIAAQNPRFWSAARRTVLEVVQRHATGFELDKRCIDHIQDDLKGDHRTLPRPLARTLRAVLEELNEAGLANAAIPAAPIRIPRPSILPADPQRYRWLPTIRRTLDVMWSEWLGEERDGNELTMAYAISLSADGGYPKKLVLDHLVGLPGIAMKDPGMVSMPIHPEDMSDRRCYLSLPASARILRPRVADHLRRKFDSEPQSKKGEKVRRKLFTELANAYSEFRRTLSFDAPSFHDLLALAPLLAWHHSLEPFFIRALHGSVLPTSHPSSSPLPLSIDQPSGPVGLIRHRPQPGSIKLPEAATLDAVSHDLLRSQPDIGFTDWTGRSKWVLRNLVRKLKDRWQKRLSTDRQAEEARRIIAESRALADALTPTKSALHLAIDWTEEKFANQRTIRPGTIETYVQRTFYAGLLADDESIDLTTWEAEDHELLIEACLSRPGLSAKAQRLTADTFRQLYTFAQKGGYAPKLSIRWELDEWIGGAGRNEILGLHEFDAFTRILREDDTRDGLIHAVTAILGFYGGLRAAEVIRLTLNDIVIGYGEIHVEIQRGKSTAARRRVPLSMLAPPDACDIVRQLVEQRRNEFPAGAVLSSIYLLGPSGNRGRYPGRLVIDSVITGLKGNFGPATVFHTLRHSFASWLVVRWYALRHPDFTHDLFGRDHPVFSPEGRRRLTQLFTMEFDDEIPDHSPFDLIIITKTIGHAGMTTLFSHYLHTFHLLHRHAMARMDAIAGQRELPGKVIARLIPKMKNPKTRATLPSRKMADLAQAVRTG